MKAIRREHPRPQFIRENWKSLDGEWNFKFDQNNYGDKEKWYLGLSEPTKIQVPFTYETELSGINIQDHHSNIWYEKELNLSSNKQYTIIFEGVDYFCEIWMNGQFIGSHKGAYERFTFDLTNFINDGENKLVVRVEDSLSCAQPRGKQRWLKDNFGCWYVQTTGIWKSVWLEEQLSDQGLGFVKMTPDVDNDQIIFEPYLKKYTQLDYIFEIEVSFDDQLVSSYKGVLHNNITSAISMDTRLREDACWGTKIWDTSNPNLYDVRFKLFSSELELLDEVFSYFGMRKISIDKSQILLNSHQLYQRLILDQGYWEESGLTSPSIDSLEKDIERIVELGYNGLRKHQKIEDERFLYLCDEKGLLVWLEMPSTYDFNDTAIENFTTEWKDIVFQNYNHPSIITWVPFNESWGIKGIEYNKRQQNFTEAIYYLTKSIDPFRPVITNDGWVHTISDILTLHDYEEFSELFKERYVDKNKLLADDYQFNKDFFAFAKGYKYQEQPVIISEFGGIAFASEKKEDWGYGNQVKSEEEFMKRFDDIHDTIQKLPYVSGYCYTQLTDVEQEINGLLDTDRNPKVDVKKIKEINERRIK